MENEKHQIASNTLAQIVGRIFVLALALISIKLITNYLGPAGTGYYNTVTTYFNFIIVLADLGLFSVTVRELSKNPLQSKKLLSNLFAFRFLSALTVTAIALIIGFLTDYPPEIKYGLTIAALFPIFNLTGSIFDMFFQYKLEMQKVALAEVISKTLTIVLMIALIYYHLGYYSIMFTLSFAAVVNFIIKAILSRKEVKISFDFNRQIISPIIKMALPLGLVFIVNNIYFKIDTLMLFYYKGAVDVGIYTVAYRVLETTLFAGSYLSSSLKPLLSRSVINDKPRAERAISQSVTFLLFMSLILAIICFTFPKEIILFLSDKDFISGKNALIILGLAGVFIYLSGLFGEVMIALDLRKTLLKISAFILIFNVLLNIYLIPRYSFIGAAWATLICEIALMTIGYLVARKSIPIKIDLKRVAKLIVISILATVVGFILKSAGLYFIINMIFVALFYIVLSYLSDAIPRQTTDEYLLSLKSKWQKR